MKKQQKSELMQKYALHSTDVGSVPVQIALLTERMREINEHLVKFPKDLSSRRGLINLVGQRQKSLRYLYRTDRSGYDQLITQLGIRSFK